MNSAPFKAVVPVTFTANARQIQFNQAGNLKYWVCRMLQSEMMFK